MIDFLKQFIDNYSMLQILYALIPYVVAIIISIIYSKFFLKNFKYSLFIIPLIIQGLISFKIYLFNYQLKLPLLDYSSLYFVTIPLIFSIALTVITYSKLTLIVKKKNIDKKGTISRVQILNILIAVFALVLNGVVQYNNFNIYVYLLSALPTLLACIVCFLLLKIVFKEKN